MLEDIVISLMWAGTPGARYKLCHLKHGKDVPKRLCNSFTKRSPGGDWHVAIFLK